MLQLSEIYEDLFDLGVDLIAEYRPLPCGSAAAVVEADGYFGVFYDLNLVDTVAKEREIASHEWAHIVTGATYTTGATPAMIQKAEQRACRAQIKKLLPFDELEAAMLMGHTDIYSLAEFFTVPEDLIRQAIEYYTGPCGLSFS